MARYSSGVRTGAGSTTLPIFSLYAGATGAPRLREVGVFNTTTTDVSVKLIRLTTTGTQGAAQTAAPYDSDAPAATASPRTTHTVAPTLGADLGYRADVGAAIGAGVIWTFADTGIRIPVGTANGIGVLIATGTGQICDVYVVWDE